MPKFGGYDFALVVTCGLTRFTRVFPCTKHITREETGKILLEESFRVYGAPKEINSQTVQTLREYQAYQSRYCFPYLSAYYREGWPKAMKA